MLKISYQICFFKDNGIFSKNFYGFLKIISLCIDNLLDDAIEIRSSKCVYLVALH